MPPPALVASRALPSLQALALPPPPHLPLPRPHLLQLLALLQTPQLLPPATPLAGLPLRCCHQAPDLPALPRFPASLQEHVPAWQCDPAAAPTPHASNRRRPPLLLLPLASAARPPRSPSRRCTRHPCGRAPAQVERCGSTNGGSHPSLPQARNLLDSRGINFQAGCAGETGAAHRQMCTRRGSSSPSGAGRATQAPT